MAVRVTVGSAGQPCTLEVGDHGASVELVQGAAGTLRATVKVSGPNSTVRETVVLVGVDAHPPRSVRLIVDRIHAILGYAAIEPGRFAPGDVIDATARGGRPRRAADSMLHALVWAAVGVWWLAGPSESQRASEALGPLGEAANLGPVPIGDGCQSRGLS